MILQSPKGFKDYLPEEALKRKFVVGKITQVFERFGFDPLETPTLEYEEVLSGKIGEEEKLIYKFETPGGDKVALKYDQTVPLARVVAQYGPQGAQKLPIPFKRYQIQSSFRGENTQKGRYREFVQCDADSVGINSPIVDAEILAIAYEIYQALGLKVVIKINDRAQIADISPKYMAAIDKLLKIGEEGVLKELQDRGLSQEDAKGLFKRVKNLEMSENLTEIVDLYSKMGYPRKSLQFDPTLIRGLDYYTGIIMEAVLVSNPTGSSVGGGGRYDKMVGNFSGTDLPASGYSVGLDRTIEAMEEEGIRFPNNTSTQVLVTIFNPELKDKSIEICSKLRTNNINCEVYLNPEAKMDKQFKYAETKGIPHVIVIGPDEAEENKLTLKNLREQTQEKITLEELINKLS
jgi:histidyl-tRNA synthetase